MFECITFENDQGAYTITLNRPDKLNSFNRQMHTEMQQALNTVEGDINARVLLISAAGKGFCAGQDLADDAVTPGGDLGEVIGNFYNPLILRITRLPLPVIAKVQGVAAGAGANLALACDLVFAGTSASFIQAFSGIGLVPDSGGTWQLPRLVGMAKALGLTLLGDRVKAEAAVDMGMIWKCVPDDELDQLVSDTVARLQRAPTLGLARTKQAIRGATNATLEKQLAVECEYQRELGRSADYAEGIAAFGEKRKPNFVGR